MLNNEKSPKLYLVAKNGAMNFIIKRILILISCKYVLHWSFLRPLKDWIYIENFLELRLMQTLFKRPNSV